MCYIVLLISKRIIKNCVLWKERSDPKEDIRHSTNQVCGKKSQPQRFPRYHCCSRERAGFFFFFDDMPPANPNGFTIRIIITDAVGCFNEIVYLLVVLLMCYIS